MWDYLDNVSERRSPLGRLDGETLHRAMVEALDPDRSISEHYRHHPHGEDGGYLAAIVRDCRALCLVLPAFGDVRSLALAEAAGCAIQALNHEPDPATRDAALKEWAHGSSPGEEPAPEHLCATATELSWFELTAAASASLVPHVLLALAADTRCAPADLVRARSAYMPWASLATAMLDSYADRLEDADSGAHSYVSHYAEEELPQRLAAILARAVREVRTLHDGDRHAVILACVIALYLSKDSVLDTAERARTHELVGFGGSLSRLLLPVLRAWRVAYAQRAV
jgi:tetraprenyl-beta-curcumene synthase